MRRILVLAVATATAAGCGGGGGSQGSAPVQQGPLGSGPNEVWYYAAKDRPRSIVVFLHGYGGPTEETPANHVPWLKHLATEGSDVIYPRYERGAYTNPFPHLDAGVRAALSRLGKPKLPTIVIGYSRGGRIALDYAALQAARGHEPRAVLAVFPAPNAPLERLGPLQALDDKTKIVLMVGDRDTGVGSLGAEAILSRLEQARFPAGRIQLIGVKSTKHFSATHLSVLQAGKGAQKAFWEPADALIDSVR